MAGWRWHRHQRTPKMRTRLGVSMYTYGAIAWIPQHYDQHYWAQRIHDLGIGTAYLGGSPTNDSLTSALEHALQPGVAARARSTGTAVRSDGAQVAARRLLTSR
jgi:UDP:flavonoid glycosyltransferase YjiC (YdhE family)